MSTDFPPLPTLDARVAALERLTGILHARIEQLSLDMNASFKQQAVTQVAFEKRVDEQFSALRSEMNARFEVVDKRFTQMEANMADGFARIIAMIDERLPPKQV